MKTAQLWTNYCAGHTPHWRQLLEITTNISLVPRPHLQGGKGSDELWLNPRFLLYGVRRKGLILIGRYGCICMWSQPAVKRTWLVSEIEWALILLKQVNLEWAAACAYACACACACSDCDGNDMLINKSPSILMTVALLLLAAIQWTVGIE